MSSVLQEIDATLTKGFPVVIQIPISWGDMDVYGHVNNTRYFRFFEDARIRYWERLKLTEVDAPRYLGVIVASTSCKFRAPLTYPDTVSVAARVLHLDDQRFSMSYRVFSHKSGRIAAMGDALMVGFNLNELKPMDFPVAVKQKIHELELIAGNQVCDELTEKT